MNECLYVNTCLMVDEVPYLTYEQRLVNECLYVITRARAGAHFGEKDQMKLKNETVE